MGCFLKVGCFYVGKGWKGSEDGENKGWKLKEG
jgi:hypothetical protein